MMLIIIHSNFFYPTIIFKINWFIEGVATYIVAPTQTALSPATIHAGTLGTYCRPRAYTVTGDNTCLYRYFFQAIGETIYALDFETNCRRRQNMPLTLKEIVAANSTDMEKSIRYCHC